AVAFVRLAAQDVRITAGPNHARLPLSGDRGRITVDLHNVPLEDAVAQITSSGRVKVTYSHKLLAGNTKVSYRGANVTVIEALNAVLRGHGVVAQPSPLGGVQLVRGETTAAQGIIVGRVTDTKTGHGISGATVAVDADTRGVVTGDDGSYRIAGLPL